MGSNKVLNRMTSKEEVDLIDEMIDDTRRALLKNRRDNQKLLGELDQLFEVKVALICGFKTGLVAQKGGNNEPAF